MTTIIWFTSSDITVLFNDQALTLKTYESGFVTEWENYVEIDNNGKLEVITGDGDGIKILNAEVGGTDGIDLSSGGSVDININDYPNGIYVRVDKAPPLEEHTYTLNITGFQSSYTLKVNGKALNTINGKKIRNLIYNGTTYEIAEPVAADEYTLTITGYTGSLSGNIPTTIKPDETITIGITDAILDTTVVSATNCDAVIKKHDFFIAYDLVISNATGNAVVELAQGSGAII